MKLFIWTLLALFPIVSFAKSYSLIPESHCSSSGEQLVFTCKKGPSFSGADLTIHNYKNEWYGVEVLDTHGKINNNEFRISLNKQNESVMVFDYPVLYSGIATIVLIKHTNRYYFSEVSYSEILGVQNITIESGRFIVKK